ncbi:mannose-6-phosphate isomerase, class I [Neolewinella antarctica]|uniref:mannose-6-phosphate isomerase n=1 Tax=Neolewinella antarctica TaxID=442734 RepID=A0ABX0X8D5_9BACT|nr:mannose-6-phosphate isomerase, class I [Neolewinella antarctica]NJC25258.1 mannose-6-phosphate isomerase [Neolewinella antarctica]
MPIIPFAGVVQNYAWGGHRYLANLLRQTAPSEQPQAEYWMGAHAKGPGVIAGSSQNLEEAIQQDPGTLLGTKVAAKFSNKLPFLFKVLDVNDMLSIQVHPTKEAAEKGFAAEEESGPDRSAPDRNYRDDNHKPELGVALTDFYLLHGFRSEAEIRKTLETVPGWADLLTVLDRQGVKGLYQRVMEASQDRVDELLGKLVASLGPESNYTRDQTEFWAARAVTQYSKDGHHDRGMFSVYWFNIVHLTPGQGVFQDAGIPHAYLEGVCIELMANSDNVLRGGLTPKHIDVPELLDKTITTAVNPKKLVPEPSGDGWLHYPTPAPDFHLSLAQIHNGGSVTVAGDDGPSILLLLKGALQSVDGQVELNEKARTVFVPANESISFNALTETVLYRASVGQL